MDPARIFGDAPALDDIRPTVRRTLDAETIARATWRVMLSPRTGRGGAYYVRVLAAVVDGRPVLAFSYSPSGRVNVHRYSLDSLTEAPDA